MLENLVRKMEESKIYNLDELNIREKELLSKKFDDSFVKLMSICKKNHNILLNFINRNDFSWVKIIKSVEDFIDYRKVYNDNEFLKYLYEFIDKSDNKLVNKRLFKDDELKKIEDIFENDFFELRSISIKEGDIAIRFNNVRLDFDYIIYIKNKEDFYKIDNKFINSYLKEGMSIDDCRDFCENFERLGEFVGDEFDIGRFKYMMKSLQIFACIYNNWNEKDILDVINNYREELENDSI
jgi:hypothetical protein